MFPGTLRHQSVIRRWQTVRAGKQKAYLRFGVQYARAYTDLWCAALALATSSAGEGACNVADAIDLRWLLQIGGQEAAAKSVLLLASLAASQHLWLHHGLAQLAFVTAE